MYRAWCALLFAYVWYTEMTQLCSHSQQMKTEASRNLIKAYGLDNAMPLHNFVKLRECDAEIKAAGGRVKG